MEYPYWPPGPSAKEEWVGIIGEYPELAPAVENPNNYGHSDQQGLGKSEGNKGFPGERGAIPGNDGEKDETKSLFCRMVDGEASRLELANAFRPERLQALGNGVCPATGAVALRVLFERLMGVDNENR